MSMLTPQRASRYACARDLYTISLDYVEEMRSYRRSKHILQGNGTIWPADSFLNTSPFQEDGCVEDRSYSAFQSSLSKIQSSFFDMSSTEVAGLF